jgi:hypothetical protein
MRTARARGEAGARADARDGLPKQQLPIGARERQREVSRRNPGQRGGDHAARAEAIAQPPAGHHHQGVRQENGGGQQPGSGLVETEFAAQN